MAPLEDTIEFPPVSAATEDGLLMVGGGLFGLVFFWVSLRALVEMWRPTSN